MRRPMARRYCPQVTKCFLPHLRARMPDRIKTTSKRHVRAVSRPPLSEREMDKVLDISGRHIGVTTPLVANIINPPQQAKSSLVSSVFIGTAIPDNPFRGASPSGPYLRVWCGVPMPRGCGCPYFGRRVEMRWRRDSSH